MMRTPARNATSVADEAPAGRKSISTRRVLVRAATNQCSDQLAACLVNHPRSSFTSFSRSNHSNATKENVIPDIPVVLTERKKSVGKMNNNGTLVNQVQSSSDEDFYKHFVDWLMRTEREIDTSTFARLKSDLYQLVGKYTLEKRN